MNIPGLRCFDSLIDQRVIIALLVHEALGPSVKLPIYPLSTGTRTT